ncbi:MAG: hypothetical protein IPN32_19770 [Deltaproteobacteria bacterium]|nr:hypothetical protein [Deltaproteobacteria bacterium]
MSASGPSDDTGEFAVRDLLAPLSRHRATVLKLALLLVGTYAYFVPAPAWNQNSRFALTRALVERGSTIIDPDHETTGDKSYRDGHFYCDKAPGTSLAATVPYAIAFALRVVAGGEAPGASVIPQDPREATAGRRPTLAQRQPGDRVVYNRSHRLALWFASVGSVGLLAVMGALAAWALAYRASGERVRVANACALTLALATPALPYATALYGHEACGALLLVATAALLLTPVRRASLGIAIVIGCALGFAVTTEYTAAPVAVVAAAWWWWRQGLRSAGWLAVGALPWVVVLATYHTVAFGSPWSTGYDWVYLPEFAAGMQVRYGIAGPRPVVLLEILFGSYRGLFYVAPVLLLAAWGLFARGGPHERLGRGATAFAAATAAYYLLLNAGYYMWDGGAAIGPRHVVPMLGLLALGLVPAAMQLPHAFATLALVSAGQMLLATAAMPEAPPFGNPLWEFALGHVLHREASTDALASNLGLLLGLPGVWSLLPLLALWAWGATLVRPDAIRSGA